MGDRDRPASDGQPTLLLTGRRKCTSCTIDGKDGALWAAFRPWIGSTRCLGLAVALHMPHSASAANLLPIGKPSEPSWATRPETASLRRGQAADGQPRAATEHARSSLLRDSPSSCAPTAHLRRRETLLIEFLLLPSSQQWLNSVRLVREPWKQVTNRSRLDLRGPRALSACA